MILIDAPTTISLGALVASLGAIGAWIVTAIKVGRFIGCYQTKVDTMWDFTIRRAQASALATGVLTQNSPLSVPQSTRNAFGALLIRQMQEFYETLPRTISHHDLTLELEKKFGQQISEEVCPPLKSNKGECLVAAALLCREVDPAEAARAA